MCKKLLMFKWFVNNNTRVIAPYNLTLFCYNSLIMLFKCKNSWSKTSPLGSPQCEYSGLSTCRESGYSQHGLSCQPWTCLAARQADRQPRLRVIDLSLHGGPGTSRKKLNRSYLELSPRGWRAKKHLQLKGLALGQIFSQFTHYYISFSSLKVHTIVLFIALGNECSWLVNLILLVGVRFIHIYCKRIHFTTKVSV